MKIDLGKSFVTLGLPVALVAVVVAVLALFGLSLDAILQVASTLIGLQFLLALTINILKFVGALSDGWAGVLSSIANILTIIGIAVWMKFYPSFDLAAADAQLYEFGKVAALVFAYIVQLIGTKSQHGFLTDGLGIKAFSFSASRL